MAQRDLRLIQSSTPRAQPWRRETLSQRKKIQRVDDFSLFCLMMTLEERSVVFFSPFRWVFNEHISTAGDVSFLHGCEVCWRHRTENKISQPGITGHKGKKDKNQNNLQTQAPTWGMRMPGASPKGWGTPLVPEPLTGSFGHLESSWL